MALAAICIWALFDVGQQHGDFQLPQIGVHGVPPEELSFFAWYSLWGALATLCTTLGLMRLGVGARLGGLLAAPRHPQVVVWMAAACVLAVAVALRFYVFLDEPVADDEATYVFQARTLLEGRLINPVPSDSSLFNNQFVVISSRGWFGKYPYGHPAFLALGEALHVRWLVVPLLSCGTVLVTYLLGERFFGRSRAALGSLLLLASPQFLMTSATQLAQPTACLLLVAGAWAALRGADEGRRAWLLLAGLILGAALCVRPMPSALFVMTIGATLLLRRRDASVAFWKRVRALTPALPGLVLGLGIVAITNRITSGSFLRSGYDILHGGHGSMFVGDGRLSASVGGALLRQNFWLFGWALSYAFIPFARPRGHAALFWGLILAEYAYRVLLPKTVVSTTGPIYVFEIVPLLALATADGAVRAADVLSRAGLSQSRAWVATSVASASLVALVTFVPVQLSAVYRSSALRARVSGALKQLDANYALVFADELVSPQRAATWAYYPPNPSPDFSDPVLFVRLPKDESVPFSAYEVWRRRFPERKAFIYLDRPDGWVLRELRIDERPAPRTTLPEFLREAVPPPVVPRAP